MPTFLLSWRRRSYRAEITSLAHVRLGDTQQMAPLVPNVTATVVWGTIALSPPFRERKYRVLLVGMDRVLEGPMHSALVMPIYGVVVSSTLLLFYIL